MVRLGPHCLHREELHAGRGGLARTLRLSIDLLPFQRRDYTGFGIIGAIRVLHQCVSNSGKFGFFSSRPAM